MPAAPVLATLLAFVLLVTTIAIAFERGVKAPLPEGSGASIQCLSYAPYRIEGETPFDTGSRVSRERLVDDLKRLSARTGCVRTYSVREGLEQVPEVARELGMKVLLGVWLGSDRAANDAQLSNGIALTKAFPETVRALVVDGVRQ